MEGIEKGKRRSEEEKRLELSLGPPGPHAASPLNHQSKKSSHLQYAQNTPSTAQKRSAPGPVVGWPPIRSFKKTGTSKPPKCGVLIKINMDGIPIGRKVDLNVHNSYEKLRHAVDELFGGDNAASDGGEYTLVYEDNEGDIMLVGDVPWHMFVSTVKRLRLLKTSDLPQGEGGNKQPC